MAIIRVMSFNIRGDYNDGESKWAFRSTLNVATIEKYAPDLIRFQEMQQVHWEAYEKYLEGYGRDLGPKYAACYLSVFWNSVRFEQTDQGRFWLSTTPEVPSTSWDAACMRSANWVKLRLKDIPAQTVMLLNTHLDHVSELARVEGARLIIRVIEDIREPGQPVIITGDFNCSPGSEPYRHFLEAGYLDSYLASGQQDSEEAYTFHKFEGVPQPEGGRIDWILISPGPVVVHPVDARIVRDADGTLYPSDHFPVIADLELGEG